MTINNQTFDYNDSDSCVSRGMFLIRNREKQMISEGYEWNINTNSCKWAIEQKILNRRSDETMMAAVIQYVESIEAQAESFNGIK